MVDVENEMVWKKYTIWNYKNTSKIKDLCFVDFYEKSSE